MSSTILPRTAVPTTSARTRRLAVAGLCAVVGVLALLYVLDIALSRGDVPRGVRIAGVNLGGRAADDAERLLSKQVQPAATRPIALTVDGTALTLDPRRAGLGIDVDASIERVQRQALNPWTRVKSFFASSDYDVVLNVEDDELKAAVVALSRRVDRGVREGAVRFDGTTPVPVLPQTGRRLQVDDAAQAIVDAWPLAAGESAVELPVEVTAVKSTEADVRRVHDEVARPAVASSVTLTAPAGNVRLTPAMIAKSLVIEADATGLIVPAIDKERLEEVLRPALGPVETPAKDATFVVTGAAISILPSAPGREVDIDALVGSLLPVLQRPAPRSMPLVIRPSEPKLSTERARGLGIREKIGEFTTYHPCCRPRVRNIHRMADIVDGAVVLPGETFSLNGFVGPRDRKRGFVDAPMILNGDFVDSVGGGVSQFATTMFNAVFFSGLKDVQHKPHSYYISRYPPGREATVSYPSPDLKWQNDSPYGVLIKTAYTEKSITVSFYGTKVFDRVESVTGERYRYRSSYTKYQSGPGCDPHSGGPGFDIVVKRLLYKSGKLVRTDRFFTRYLPDPTIRCR